MTPLTSLAASLTRRLLWLIPPLLVLAVMGCSRPAPKTPPPIGATCQRVLKEWGKPRSIQKEPELGTTAWFYFSNRVATMISFDENERVVYWDTWDVSPGGQRTINNGGEIITMPEERHNDIDVDSAVARCLIPTPAPASAGKSGASTPARRP